MRNWFINKNNIPNKQKNSKNKIVIQRDKNRAKVQKIYCWHKKMPL